MKNINTFLILHLLILVFSFSCKSHIKNTTDIISTEKNIKVQQALTTFILVRHAEKAKDGSKNPKLTEAGQKRAERLKKMLETVNVSVIYTTDYNRTRQTVAPIAQSLDIEAQIYQPHDKGILDELKTAHTGEVILMAGHSNTIPAIVNHLIGKEKYQDLEESDYENLFIVTLMDGGTAKVLNLKF